jgi:thymidine kinase
MFTGKTETLLKYLDKATVSERVLIKHKLDIRYDDVCVVSHKGTRFPALNVSELGEFSKQDEYYSNLKLIAVDEGQFFPDLAEHAHQWALHGKHVVIAAIQTDMFTDPLPDISRVIAKADRVTHLSGICTQCQGIGSFSYRKNALPDGEETVQKYVGGVKDYTLLCRACYQRTMHEAFTNRSGMFIKKEARDRFKKSLKEFDVTSIQETPRLIVNSSKIMNLIVFIHRLTFQGVNLRLYKTTHLYKEYP